MKMFVIPCQVGNKKVPVQFYIGEHTPKLHPIKYQTAWINEVRGVIVPDDVKESLQKLADISEENDVSFVDLCTYALNYPTDKKKSSKVAGNSANPLRGNPEKIIDSEKAEAHVLSPASESPKSQLRPPTDEELEKYGEEIVSVLLMGHNKMKEKIYNYIKIKFKDYFDLRSQIEAGGRLDIQKYGEVIAAGKGEPSAETRAEIESKYKFLSFPEV